jgi:hypothetical protein
LGLRDLVAVLVPGERGVVCGVDAIGDAEQAVPDVVGEGLRARRGAAGGDDRLRLAVADRVECVGDRLIRVMDLGQAVGVVVAVGRGFGGAAVGFELLAAVAVVVVGVDVARDERRSGGS